MATYTGDATLVQVFTATGTRTVNGSESIYTVPVGHFAEIQLVNSSYVISANIGSQAFCSIGPVAIFSVDGGTDPTSGGVALSITDTVYPITLDEGNSCTVGVTDFLTTETCTLTVIVKEFKKP